METKKSKKKLIIIIIVAIVLFLLIIGLVLFFALRGKKTVGPSSQGNHVEAEDDNAIATRYDVIRIVVDKFNFEAADGVEMTFSDVDENHKDMVLAAISWGLLDTEEGQLNGEESADLIFAADVVARAFGYSIYPDVYYGQENLPEMMVGSLISYGSCEFEDFYENNEPKKVVTIGTVKKLISASNEIAQNVNLLNEENGVTVKDGVRQIMPNYLNGMIADLDGENTIANGVFANDDVTMISFDPSSDFLRDNPLSVGEVIAIQAGPDDYMLHPRRVERIEDGRIELSYAPYDEVFEYYYCTTIIPITPQDAQSYLEEYALDITTYPLKDASKYCSAEAVQICSTADLENINLPLADNVQSAEGSPKWAFTLAYDSSVGHMAENGFATISVTLVDNEAGTVTEASVPLPEDNLGEMSFSYTVAVNELDLVVNTDMVWGNRATISFVGDFNVAQKTVIEDGASSIEVPIPALNYGFNALNVVKASAGLSLVFDIQGSIDIHINHIRPNLSIVVDLDHNVISIPDNSSEKTAPELEINAAAEMMLAVRLGIDIKVGDFNVIAGLYCGADGALNISKHEDNSVCTNISLWAPMAKLQATLKYPVLFTPTTGIKKFSYMLPEDPTFVLHFEDTQKESFHKVEKCTYGDAITVAERNKFDELVAQKIMDDTTKLALQAYYDYFDVFVDQKLLAKAGSGDNAYFYCPPYGNGDMMWFALAYIDDDYVPELIVTRKFGSYPDYVAGLDDQVRIFTFANGQVSELASQGERSFVYYIPKQSEFASTNGKISSSLLTGRYEMNAANLKLLLSDDWDLLLDNTGNMYDFSPDALKNLGNRGNGGSALTEMIIGNDLNYDVDRDGRPDEISLVTDKDNRSVILTINDTSLKVETLSELQKLENFTLGRDCNAALMIADLDCMDEYIEVIVDLADIYTGTYDEGVMEYGDLMVAFRYDGSSIKFVKAMEGPNYKTNELYGLLSKGVNPYDRYFKRENGHLMIKRGDKYVDLVKPE